ncbi:MAG: NusG domain II-containing protein [Mariprofundaceae bacterium]|nr:NusG domain II-containing protein [Mariprofundaceae bacterium]
MPNSFYYYLRGTWLDRLLLSLLLLGIISIGFVFSQGKNVGVSIFHGQTLVAWYPLPQKAVIQLDVQGELGVSTLKIDGMHVRFLSSPCKNQYCVAQHDQHSVGQMAACVPNRVMFMIDGESSLDVILE